MILKSKQITKISAKALCELLCPYYIQEKDNSVLFTEVFSIGWHLQRGNRELVPRRTLTCMYQTGYIGGKGLKT